MALVRTTFTIDVDYDSDSMTAKDVNETISYCLEAFADIVETRKYIVDGLTLTQEATVPLTEIENL